MISVSSLQWRGDERQPVAGGLEPVANLALNRTHACSLRDNEPLNRFLETREEWEPIAANDSPLSASWVADRPNLPR